MKPLSCTMVVLLIAFGCMLFEGTTQSAPAPAGITGLDFPGNAGVHNTMRFKFTNPLAIYPATYIWRAYPRQQNGYYTTFFWGNDGAFTWDNGTPNTFYGAHPYPYPDTWTHKWEIATDQGVDWLTSNDVSYNRWYTQALVAWADSQGYKHTTLYWDLPDTTKVLDYSTRQSSGATYGNKYPPFPALTFGDAPWNPGHEVYNGILRGIQVYSTNLSLSDIQSEANAALSTVAGASNIWYLNLNPTPSDISDKSSAGHNPAWVGSERPSLYSQSSAPDTTPPTVSISGPANGTTVSGSLSVAATASDNVGVAGVQFKLDGANLGTELTAGPWAVQWNTLTAINGAHTLTAVVRDAAGNTATASPVTVQVSNAPGSVISAFVQTAGLSNNGGGGNIAAAFNAATNAGNLIVAAVSWGDPSSLTCSDSQGNVYTTATTQYDSAMNQSLGICYAANIKGGTDTVTAGFSGNPGYRRILTHEYSGILAGNPIDAVAKNISNGTTAANSVTSTAANTSNTDLIFGAVMNDSGNLLNIQAGTNFTLRGSLNGADLATEDSMPVAPGPTAATWTFATADRYLAQVVAFKLASTPAPLQDTTLPTVSVTAPTSGATVSSTINVSANASDNVAVVGVQFKLDGANLGAEVTSQPYSILWDTTAAANGSHTLTAAARDAAGNQAASSPVSFTVNNAAPDTVPPAVSLTNPADGSTVSATIAVSAMASDNVGVVGVQFQLDGANLGAEVTVAPYSTSLNTTTVTDGTHTLTAVARDAAGNPTTSAAVSVTVGNNTAPTVSILTPTINSALSSTVPVSATASDSAGIAGVQFQVDGANWGAEVTSPPYKMSWNTSKMSNGSHILRALARDNTGKRTISSGVAVRVSNPIRKRLHNQLTSSFTISGSGGKSFFTGQGSPLTDNASAATSTADPLQIGYAGVQMDTTPSSLSGFAILSGRVGGVLVGEASVPATPTMSSGRVYANINGPINTGIAFANPNSEDAVISFYFTDGSGNNFGQGSFTLGANQQISRFLNQNPFNGSTSMEGTFTFNASVPVGVTAIQGFINQRSEFLISLLPVASLGELNNNAVLLPHFTDGAGWTTQVVLTNPSDDPINGRVQFFGTGSINQDATPLSLSVNGITNSIFSYGIAPRSAVRLVTGNSGGTVRTGSIRITPSIGNAPVAVEMFSYLDRGILVSQASILAASTGSTFRMYAETSGPVTQPLSIQSGVAIANPGQAPVTVDIALTQMDGSTVGQPTTVTIPANGQTARFVKELFPSSPNNFSGFITVTASSPIGVVGLRARYNERGDFLITPTPPRNDSDTVTDSEVVFPHVVSSGAGYSSQFVIFGQTGSGGIYFNSADGTPMPAASLRPVQ